MQMYLYSCTWLNELTLTVSKIYCERSSAKETTKKAKAMDLVKFTHR